MDMILTPLGANRFQNGADRLIGSLSKLADSRILEIHSLSRAISFPMSAGRLTRLAVHSGTPERICTPTPYGT